MKVLLVEDDVFFREAVKDTLQQAGYTVLEAKDGKIAKEALNLKPIDLVVSDIQMPFMTGVELFEWAKEKKLKTKFILMTGFSKLLETKGAFEMGVDGFLNKPFRETELLANINRIFGTKKEKENELTEKDFCKVSLNDFVSGSKILFSIYIKLGEKFVRLAYKGEDISLERVKQYKEKGISHLYITKTDYAQLVGYNMTIAKNLKVSNKMSHEIKRNFMKYTGEVLLEKVYVSEVDKETYNLAKDYIETSLGILTEDDNAANTLHMLSEHSDHIYAHSIGVSLYGYILAKELGWNSPSVLFKVSLCGLLHDIGLKEVDRSILNKTRVELSADERKLIESHAIRGKEILESLPNIPLEVVQAAFEHHESVDGTGYPMGKRSAKIASMSKLIRIADVFCNYAIKNPNSSGMSSGEAIRRMEMLDISCLDKEMFIAFKKALKVA